MVNVAERLQQLDSLLQHLVLPDFAFFTILKKGDANGSLSDTIE